MRASLRIARVWGIEIRVHASWLLIFALVTWSLGAGYFPESYPLLDRPTTWILAVVSALLLFASVVVHELSHSLVARAHGLEVHSITMFVFGGISELKGEPTRASTEFLVAIAGPIASFVVSGVAYAASLLTSQVSLPLTAMAEYLALINAILGAFNLLPGFPLDGGRVLRSVLWGITRDLARATRIAASAGKGVAYGLIALGMLQLFAGNVAGGLWIAFIGWFLIQATEQTTHAMDVQSAFVGVKVGELLKGSPRVVEGDAAVADLAAAMLQYGERAVLVMQASQLVGIADLKQVRRVARELWGSTPARAIMHPLEQEIVSPSERLLTDVLTEMGSRHADYVVVMDEEQVLGLLTLLDIARFMELRTALAEARPQAERQRAA